jgi:hypothetical protein
MKRTGKGKDGKKYQYSSSTKATVTGAGTYPAGTTVQLKATLDDDDYEFVGWYSTLPDWRSEDNPLSRNRTYNYVTTNQNVTLYAVIVEEDD